VVNASVCKTDTRGFESHPGLTHFISLKRFIKCVSPGEVCLRTLHVDSKGGSMSHGAKRVRQLSQGRERHIFTEQSEDKNSRLLTESFFCPGGEICS